MEDEVVRIEAVKYLMGASGHGALSTLFLILWGLLVALGEWSLGLIVLVVAAGIGVNGVSLFVWDRLTERFEMSAESVDRTTTRTLRPHRISSEMRAEMLAGFVMVSVFVLLVTVVVLTIQALEARTAVYLSASVLALGNLTSLAWWYHTNVR